MRRTLDGFYDRAAQGGPITGSGPGWQTAVLKYSQRIKASKQRGKWLKGGSNGKAASWKTNKGTRMDPSWYIVGE